MTDAPIHDTDFDETLFDVRRCLEDLLAFEGRYFVVPEAAIAASPPSVADSEDSVPPANDRPGDGGDLETFRQQICECVRCPLGHTRTNFVFGSGNPHADILFVGEAPGQQEDRRGYLSSAPPESC